MKLSACLGIALLGLAAAAHADEGWVPLFDGKSLDGWKANENSTSWKAEGDRVVCFGPRCHLFYTGAVESAQFKDFDFKAEVMTHPKANSGIYFHTRVIEKGWPDRGYECQVNNTHSDPKKTGGLYAIQDVMNVPPAKDDEWFTYEISVRGKHIVVKINGKVTTDYTEPADLNRPERQVSSGTFALQAHDPGSRVEYRNVQVRPVK